MRIKSEGNDNIKPVIFPRYFFFSSYYVLVWVCTGAVKWRKIYLFYKCAYKAQAIHASCLNWTQENVLDAWITQLEAVNKQIGFANSLKVRLNIKYEFICKHSMNPVMHNELIDFAVFFLSRFHQNHIQSMQTIIYTLHWNCCLPC